MSNRDSAFRGEAGLVPTSLDSIRARTPQCTDPACDRAGAAGAARWQCLQDRCAFRLVHVRGPAAPPTRTLKQQTRLSIAVRVAGWWSFEIPSTNGGLSEVEVGRQRLRFELGAAVAVKKPADMVESELRWRNCRHEVISMHKAVGALPDPFVVRDSELVRARPRHAKRIDSFHFASPCDDPVSRDNSERTAQAVSGHEPLSCCRLRPIKERLKPRPNTLGGSVETLCNLCTGNASVGVQRSSCTSQQIVPANATIVAPRPTAITARVLATGRTVLISAASIPSPSGVIPHTCRTSLIFSGSSVS